MNLNRNKYKLRIPKLEEINGENMLSVLKKRGRVAKLSDSAIFLGGHGYGNLYGDYYIANTYDAESAVAIGPDLYFYKEKHVSRNDREVGIRLILELDSNDDIPTNGEEPIISGDGVLEVEFGYLPKYIINELGTGLREAEKKGKFKETPYEYTTDYRKIRNVYNDDYRENRNKDDNKIIPNKRRVYKYKGDLYIKQSYMRPYYHYDGSYEYDEEEYFASVSPVKWLVDLKAGKMITEDIVWAGVEFDNIQMFIDNYLSQELFQIEKRNRIDISKKSIGEVFRSLFHRKDKIKALPEGTGNVEGIKQTNVNEEPKVISENVEEEQSKRDRFKESIRVEFETVETEQNNDVYKGPKENTRERVASSDTVKTGVNNISNAPINQEDGEIYPQHPYYAKAKVDLSKPPYEPKAKGENAQGKQSDREKQQDGGQSEAKGAVRLPREYFAKKIGEKGNER